MLVFDRNITPGLGGLEGVLLEDALSSLERREACASKASVISLAS